MRLRQRWVRLLCAGVGVILLCSYGYFSSGSGPNQNTRYDMVRALVEEGTLAIDDYHENTIDKASFRGHFYSDKAPGSSLLALPVYAAGYALHRLVYTAEQVTQSRKLQRRLFGWVQLWAASIPGAVLGALILLFLLELAAPRPRVGWAAVAALTLGLGSPLFAYSTMFLGHALSALGLFAGFFLLFRDTANAPTRAALLTAGACFGLATLSEYPAAPAAVILFAVRCWPARGTPARDWLSQAGRTALWIAAGSGPFAALFALNNRLVSGSWVVVGYASVQDQFKSYQDTGFYGVSLPSPGVLLDLLVGKLRGILLLSPILLAIVPGFLPVWRQDRRIAIALAATIAYYLLLNASYAVWWGGAAVYPRHLTSAIPFFAPFVYFALAERHTRLRSLRVSTVIAAVVSVVNGLVIVAVYPQTQNTILFPLRYVYESLFRGELGTALWWEPFRNSVTNRELLKGTNLGMSLLDETNAWSLVPLLLFWAVAAFVLARLLARAGAPLWAEVEVSADPSGPRRGAGAGTKNRPGKPSRSQRRTG